MWYKLKRIMMRPNGVEKQVRPIGWKPWANTIAYYKFDWNLNDSSGNSYNLSVAAWSITYWTASWWWKYAHINKNTRTNYWEKSFDYNWNNTISLRMNPQITNGSILLEMWSRSNEFLRFNGAIFCWFWWDMTYSMSANTRYLVTFTRSWTSTALYINGSLIWTWIGGKTWTHNIRFKLNNAGDTSSSTYSNNSYWSELIWENKTRTAQEVTDYYNLTKWNYWL